MRHLRSEAGLSLAELMIVVMVGGFSLVTIMGLLLNSSGTANTFTKSIDAEVDEIAATTAFRSLFGQAVELTLNGNADLNLYTNSSGKGRVREYDSDTEFNAAPSTRTLAIFMREATMSNPTGAAGVATSFQPTGVYFQKPTATTWGVLIFNLGQSGSLEPTRSDLIFEGLTRVRILNPTTFDPDTSAPKLGAPVTGFDVELTFRRFFGDVKPELRTFCPHAFLTSVPACTTGAHKDVSRVFRVLIRNNTLAMSPSAPRASRLYDLIHFFALNKGSELR